LALALSIHNKQKMSLLNLAFWINNKQIYRTDTHILVFSLALALSIHSEHILNQLSLAVSIHNKQTVVDGGQSGFITQ